MREVHGPVASEDLGDLLIVPKPRRLAHSLRYSADDIAASSFCVNSASGCIPKALG
jgi:hypothetical protein